MGDHAHLCLEAEQQVIPQFLKVARNQDHKPALQNTFSMKSSDDTGTVYFYLLEEEEDYFLLGLWLCGLL